MAVTDKNSEVYVTVEIIADAIVVYNDGKKELFEAIYMTKSWVSTGHILSNGGYHEFIETGGIPQDSILWIGGGKTMKTRKKRGGYP